MPLLDPELLLERFRVAPGKKCKLKDFDPGWEGNEAVPEAQRREWAAEVLAESRQSVSEAQELLAAADSWSVLLILQAMDAAGKDGTIKHVMSGVNPQGVEVHSFKAPSPEELDHDFLWRCGRVLPRRGHIGIFNRSYYEEVLVVKVHPQWIERQRIPQADPAKKKFWEHRYDSINDWERHLTRNGVQILKVFLNVSKDEQRRRFLERLDDPEKHWKFSAADVAERAHWSEYQKAISDMLSATSTKWAPWHVIPADHKWVSRAAVASLLAHTIRQLKLKFPTLTSEQEQAMEEARHALDQERPAVE
jgi:PPK2 family polyphosphate:nucleotide phosphotransferase